MERLRDSCSSSLCDLGNPRTFRMLPRLEMAHQHGISTSGRRRFETFSHPTTMEVTVPDLGSQLLASSFSTRPSNAPLF
jgi:hypothetical protein